MSFDKIQSSPENHNASKRLQTAERSVKFSDQEEGNNIPLSRNKSLKISTSEVMPKDKQPINDKSKDIVSK